MRKFVHRLRLTGIILFLAFFTIPSIMAQSQTQTTGFSYQAVARDNSGNPLSDQALTARISIHIGSESGELIWQEDHDVQTNTLGLFNLVVGGSDGYAQTGSAASFGDIDWAAQQMYLKVWIKTDNDFVNMGGSPIQTVPVAQYAKSAKNSSGNFSVQSDKPATNGEALFEVKRSDGSVAFAVYEDMVYVYVDTSDTKGVKGGFAVGGYSKTAKGSSADDYLRVTPDSVRVKINMDDTKGVKGGFAVGGYSKTSKSLNEELLYISGNNAVDVVYDKAQILWYPKKEAFLAGNISIGSPDSVGTNSTALGYRSVAMGNWSQAFGYRSMALGDYSTAIGREAESQLSSFAFGYKAKALGNESYAFGSQAEASGNLAFAIGVNSLASGFTSVAIGYQSRAISNFANAFGVKAYADSDYSMALGMYSRATQTGAFAAGYESAATNKYSLALGFHANALGQYSTAIGYYARTSNNNAFAVGDSALASGLKSISIGSKSSASGTNSVAMGNDVISSNTNSISIGNRTQASGPNSTALGYEAVASGSRAISIGAYYSKSFVFYIPYIPIIPVLPVIPIILGKGDGEIAELPHKEPESSSKGTFVSLPLTANRDNQAIGTYSLAIGNGNISENGGMTFGIYNRAREDYSAAIGFGNDAVGQYSFAAGFANKSEGYYATAMGRYTSAASFNSFTIGTYNNSVGDPDSWIETDPIFQIGNGSSSGDTHDAFRVNKNGGAYFYPIGNYYGVYNYTQDARYGLYTYNRNSGYNGTTYGLYSVVGRYNTGAASYYSGYFADAGSAGTYYGLYADLRGGDAIDVAEYIYDTYGTTEAGDVLIADPNKTESVIVSEEPFQSSVVGVVTTEPHLVMGMDLVIDENGEPIPDVKATRLALTGRVPCKVTDENGPIKPGDLLTTSSTPGHAMKWSPLDVNEAKDFDELKKMLSENEMRRHAVIGKAVEAHAGGSGKIMVLISLQ